LTGECIKSVIDNCRGISYEIIVVDNASSDGSAGYIREHFPEVNVLENSRNLGFAAANNRGAAAANGRYLLLLNSDTIVREGAIEAMYGYLEDNDDAALCTCKLLNEDGTLQWNVRRFPTFVAMLHRHTFFDYFKIFYTAREHYRMLDFDYDSDGDVDQVSGAVILVRRDVYREVGGMDENMHFYFEETDFCYQIVQKGYRIHYTPDATILHLGGASSDKLSSAEVQLLYFKGMMYYFRKNAGGLKTFCFVLLFKFGVLVYTILELIKEALKYVIYKPIGKKFKPMKIKLNFDFLVKKMLRFMIS
jgi:hypothetical protein